MLTQQDGLGHVPFTCEYAFIFNRENPLFSVALSEVSRKSLVNRSYRYFESTSSYVQSVSEARCRLVLLTVCLTLSTGLFAQDNTPCDSGSSKPNAGAGTKMDPYKICNIRQLQNITTLTANYLLVTDIDASETRTTMVGGFFDRFSGFFPIGVIFYPGIREPIDSRAFSGVLDGDGHQIFDILIHHTSEDDAGLFARLDGAVVKNLVFSKADVAGGNRVGVLTGRAAGSTISNITVTNSVVAGDSEVGILAGRAEGNSTISNITVTNSEVTGSAQVVGGVIGDSNGVDVSDVRVTASRITGKSFVGGVAGRQLDGRISTARVTASTITATNKGGGMVGIMSGGIIQGSAAIGILIKGGFVSRGKPFQGRQLGGLVGRLLGKGVIRQSYATGLVGRLATGLGVGGLVGYLQPGALVENSYAWVGVAGDSPIGGLVGANLGTIRNTYAYSVVTPAGGPSYLGALVGSNGPDFNSVTGAIEGSYVAGKVNGATPVRLAGSYAVTDEEAGTITESSTRTLSQLRCPVSPSSSCVGATPESLTFAGWNPDIWYFGSAHTLPVLKGLTRIPATPTDVSLEWSSANSLVLRSASTPDVTYYKLGLEVGESSTVLFARSPNFELNDLSRELRGNFAGGDSVSYTVRVSSETRVVNPPSGDGNENTQIVTEIVSPPSTGSFILLDVPGTPTMVSTPEGATTVRVTVGAPANDGYGRGATDPDYGSKVGEVDLNFAYVVSATDDSDNLVPGVTMSSTAASVTIDLDGLRAGTQYRIVAFAQNAVGAGGKLFSEYFKTLDGEPEAPIVVTTRETTQRLVLSWTAPHHGGSTITAYVVTVGGDTVAKLTIRLDSASTVFVVDSTMLSSIRSISRGGDKIFYSVRAENAKGTGSLSTGTFTLLAFPGTLTFTQVQVTAGITTVRVTVYAPDNDGYGRRTTDTAYGSEAEGVDLKFAYVVSVTDSSGKAIASTVMETRSTSMTLVLGGLEPETQYTVVAFVQNALGPGGTHQREFMTRGTPTTDRVRLRLRGYLGGAVR